jgi:hypothetical protein
MMQALLRSGAYLVLTLLASPLAAQTIVKTDRQWDGTEGQYMVYASPWCANYDKTLVEGRDYSDTISYRTGDLATATNVQLSWRWPLVSSPKCGVRGYNHVAWGNYDSGSVRSPVAPRQVSSVADFTLTYEVEDAGGYATGYNGYNGLGEFYLTKVAGDANTKAIEIGWYWNAPSATRAWAKSGRDLGTFKDRNKQSWKVAANVGGAAGLFVTFTPDNATGRKVKGDFDGKGAITYLTAAGVVQPTWWLNGAAIGVEPTGGVGTAVVRKFTVSVK